MIMICNKNEKCLLNFIAGYKESSGKDDLMKLILDFGIKIDFKNHNSVYQIIDELNYGEYFSRRSL